MAVSFTYRSVAILFLIIFSTFTLFITQITPLVFAPATSISTSTSTSSSSSAGITDADGVQNGDSGTETDSNDIHSSSSNVNTWLLRVLDTCQVVRYDDNGHAIPNQRSQHSLYGLQTPLVLIALALSTITFIVGTNSPTISFSSSASASSSSISSVLLSSTYIYKSQHNRWHNAAVIVLA